jgi:hypothetical protein
MSPSPCIAAAARMKEHSRSPSRARAPSHHGHIQKMFRDGIMYAIPSMVHVRRLASTEDPDEKQNLRRSMVRLLLSCKRRIRCCTCPTASGVAVNTPCLRLACAFHAYISSRPLLRSARLGYPSLEGGISGYRN